MPAGAKDDVFEVERIVRVRARRAKDPLLYRVRWKGFTEEDDTYEPADALAGAAGLLRQFIDKGRPQDMLGKVVNVRVGDETSRAVVREVLAERREYYVHYLGWSSTWDQWINADQVDGDSGTVSAAGHREPARSPKNRRRTESVSQQVGSERLTPSAPPPQMRTAARNILWTRLWVDASVAGSGRTRCAGKATARPTILGNLSSTSRRALARFASTSRERTP